MGTYASLELSYSAYGCSVNLSGSAYVGFRLTSTSPFRLWDGGLVVPLHTTFSILRVRLRALTGAWGAIAILLPGAASVLTLLVRIANRNSLWFRVSAPFLCHLKHLFPPLTGGNYLRSLLSLRPLLPKTQGGRKHYKLYIKCHTRLVATNATANGCTGKHFTLTLNQWKHRNK